MRDWIYLDNLEVLLDLCAAELGYDLDDGDLTAVHHGLTSTDQERDVWFDYSLVGSVAVDLRLAVDRGSSVVFVDISAPEPVVSFLHPLVVAMQRYRFVSELVDRRSSAMEG